jgi:hypothetical protein
MFFGQTYNKITDIFMKNILKYFKKSFISTIHKRYKIIYKIIFDIVLIILIKHLFYLTQYKIVNNYKFLYLQ